MSDLSFGDVFIGYNAEVQHTDPGAAKFSFYHSAAKKKNIRISFTLPSVLSYGADSIPIIFDLAHSAWSFNDQIAGRTTFDPFSKVKLKKLDSFQTVYIWIGGQVTTSTGLPPGLYQATFVITVEY